MSMESIAGLKIPKPPWLDTLRPIVYLVYYESPLLTHFRTANARNILRLWVDCDKNRERWLLFAISQYGLKQYRDREVSLLDLVSSPEDGFIYCLDTARTSEGVDVAQDYVTILNQSSIPLHYLPLSDSFFEPEDQRYIGGSVANYDIDIDGSMSLGDLEQLPNLYSQAYSFIYCLETDPSTEMVAFKSALRALPWKGGWSRAHFFHNLKAWVPKSERPKIKSMHFASPGWIELTLNPSIARELAGLIYSYNNSAEEIHFEVLFAQRQLTKRALRGKNSKTFSNQVSDEDLAFCKQQYLTLCGLLRFRSQDRLLAASSNSFAALKILVTFIYRVRDLARMEANGKATF